MIIKNPKKIKRTKKVYKPKKKLLRKTTIKKVVRKELNRISETKVQISTFNLNPSSIQVGTTSIVGNFWTINPSNSASGYNVGRGTNNTQMIGNKITLSSCKIRFIVAPNAYNATTNPSLLPLYFIVYLYRNKLTPDQDPTAAEFAGSGTFFENGPSYTGFSGTIMDLNRRLNTENYVYLTRYVFKIGPSEPPVGNTPTPSLALTNNDFKLSYATTIDVSKHLPKKQVLNDNSTWQTPRVIMLCQVVPAVPGLGNYNVNVVLPCNIQGQVEYRFKDE